MTRAQFETFAKGCQASVRRFLTALCCGDSFAADDIAQDAFMKAYLSCDDIRDEGKFSAWIFKIAYNTFINDLRRRKEIYSIDTAYGITGCDDADKAFRYEALYSALRRLSDKERATILLYYLQGYSIKEVAELEGVSQDAVKQHLSRGRSHLKNLLTENH